MLSSDGDKKCRFKHVRWPQTAVQQALGNCQQEGHVSLGIKQKIPLTAAISQHYRRLKVSETILDILEKTINTTTKHKKDVSKHHWIVTVYGNM